MSPDNAALNCETVPEIVLFARSIDLLVSVCEPEFVVTLLSMLRVKVPAPSSYSLSKPVPSIIVLPITSWITSVDPDIGIHGPSGADRPL